MRDRVAAVRRDPRSRARLVLAIGALSGIQYTISQALYSPEQFGLASSVYVTAAEAWLSGGDPYAVTPPELPGYHYIYPPVMLLVFAPYAVLGGETLAYAGQIVANLVVGAAISWVLVRALERRGVEVDRLDWLVIGGFVLASPLGIAQVIQGQTTLWLALALAAGFELIERDRDLLGGAVIALPAVVKVFPAVVGLWLIRRRAYRGVVVAVVVGLGALVLGAVVLGVDLTEQFVGEVLLGRLEDQSGRRQTDPTTSVGGIGRQLHGLFGLSGAWLTLVALAVATPLLAASYRHIDTDVRRLGAMLATVLLGLMVLPMQPLYFPLIYYPMVLLLYRLRRGWAATFLTVGALLTLVKVTLEPVVAAVGHAPEPLANIGIGLTEAVFAVALPTDVAMWCLLACCVLVQRGRSGASG
ncbi:MAG: glycosyltransferase family 87 protein [Halobacteriales archaeon]